jgi:hypothetical protein
MRISLLVHQSLFFVRQPPAKPFHRRPPGQNNAVLLDGGKRAPYNKTSAQGNVTFTAARGITSW